jgi:hypothetical protein
MMEKAWNKLDAQIKRRAKLCEMSAEDLRKLREQYSTESEVILSSNDLEQYQVTFDDIRYSTSPYYAQVMRFYQSLIPTALEPLLIPNARLCFNSNTDEVEWKIPQLFATDLMAARRAVLKSSSAPIPDIEPEGINLEIAISNMRKYIDLQAQLVFRMPEQAQYSSIVTQKGGTILTFSSAHMSLGGVRVEGETWRSGGDLPTDPDNTLLGKKVTLSITDVLREMTESEKASQEVNRSDVLAALHNKLGLQIVADHYSQWFSIKDFTDKTVAEVLSELFWI